MKVPKYKGFYLTVTEEEMSDGHVYERVTLRPGVKVFPYKDGKVLGIKEYRRHEKRTRWKFIGGWVDKDGLTSLEIAQGELDEEAGMRAEKWEEIYRTDSENNTIDDRTTCFVCEDISVLANPTPNPDSDKVEEMMWLTSDDIWQLLDSGEMLWDRDALLALQVLRIKNQEND